MTATPNSFKQTMSGSVGAGLKSVFGNNRSYYILQHLNTSKYHKTGELQEIIVDNVQLGRSPKCQVRFDDEGFPTVSRNHAAIVREGQKWKLLPLSTTNSTYLNGNKLQGEWFLENGDEIQLASNGPKLKFVVPTGKKASVGSIQLSRRLSLFRKQALQPYKRALLALGAMLLLVTLGGGALIYNLWGKNTDLQAKVEAYQKDFLAINQKNDSLAKELGSSKETIGRMKTEMTRLATQKPQVITRTVNRVVKTDQLGDLAIKDCIPYVYYIECVGFDITTTDGMKTTLRCGEDLKGWSGTGFLLSDGRFVTARHVIEAWAFFAQGGTIDEEMAKLNYIAHNGGKVVAHFVAVSSVGDKLTLSSDQFSWNKANDHEINGEEGTRLVQAYLDNTDYAVCRVGKSRGLQYNADKSRHLKQGTQLQVLGFPLGVGANSISDIRPLLGSGLVATDGLQNGVILTTATNYEQGNSGGPVFCANESGTLEVIGLVSAAKGKNLGFIVPLSSVR